MRFANTIINLVDPSGLSGQCRPQPQANNCIQSPINPDDRIASDYRILRGVYLTTACYQSEADLSNKWNPDRLNDVRQAFGKVDSRFSTYQNAPLPKFTSVYDKLEFRLVSPDTGLVYGETPTARFGKLVNWNWDTINTIPLTGGYSIAESFQYTVVHELGHVLLLRTSHLAGTSIRSVMENMGVPAINSQALGRLGIQICNSSFSDCGSADEKVADHFFNWVYETYDTSKIDPNDYNSPVNEYSGKIISAFWIGDIKVAINNGNIDEVNGVVSPGIAYWLNNAR